MQDAAFGMYAEALAQDPAYVPALAGIAFVMQVAGLPQSWRVFMMNSWLVHLFNQCAPDVVVK